MTTDISNRLVQKSTFNFSRMILQVQESTHWVSSWRGLFYVAAPLFLHANAVPMGTRSCTCRLKRFKKERSSDTNKISLTPLRSEDKSGVIRGWNSAFRLAFSPFSLAYSARLLQQGAQECFLRHPLRRPHVFFLRIVTINMGTTR